MQCYARGLCILQLLAAINTKHKVVHNIFVTPDYTTDIFNNFVQVCESENEFYVLSATTVLTSKINLYLITCY